MEIDFKLHRFVNWRELDAVVEKNNVDLAHTHLYCLVPEFIDLNVCGSLASIIALFMYLKDKYGNRIAKNIKIDGKINVETIDALIEYLTSLKEDINASTNISNNTDSTNGEQNE